MSDRARRVLVLVSQLGFGGAERQTYELLARLAARGEHALEVLCLSDQVKPYGRMIQDLDLPLEVLPRQRSFDLGRVATLRRRIRAAGADVLYCVHYEASAYGWGAALGLREPAFLPSIRSTVVRPRSPKRQIYTRMLRAAPLVLANSHAGADYIASYFGVPRAALRVVENGVPFAELERRAGEGADLREELGLAPGTPLVAFVGKDSKHKNVRRFLRVCRLLEEEVPDAHFILAGWKLGPEDAERLHATGPRYHLLGLRDDVPRILRDANLLILSSNTEGCPNTVIEAAGLGTPVVAPPVGDCPVILEPLAERMLTEDQEPRSYAALAAPLLRRGLQEDEARRLMGWVRERYGLERMVDATVESWELAAGTSRPR